MQQVTISTFYELLNSDNVSGTLLEALRKLTEVADPQQLADIQDPEPLGAWAGWN